MTPEAFLEVIEDTILEIRNSLDSKGKEYSRGDRLSNFKQAAAADQTTAETVCVHLWLKHVISILDMVRDITSGHYHSEAIWEEKIKDAINYPILLRGLLLDSKHMLSVLDKPIPKYKNKSQR